ncbi:MAG: PIG-L deacetylase family protein [Actinomycetota bacterium]
MSDELHAAGPVLAVFAHPDDAEIGAGGTMARWASEGREVHLLILTNGDKGSQVVGLDSGELARIRAEETVEAGRILGLHDVRVLDTPDGELENVFGVRAAVARRIRELRPDTVLSCDPTTFFIGNRYINHADHRAAGAVACDAVFPGAGNPQFFPDQIADGLEPWDVPQVWLAWTTEPNHREDITGHMRTKLDALAAHASQIEGDMLGFFEEWLPLEAAEAGRMIGVEHAEAFRRLDLRPES